MYEIRCAKADEAEILSDIALRSEAYWGYDDEYMERFASTYYLTKDYILENPTFVIENDTQIIGFYSILCESGNYSLDYFFIDPKFIGDGYGRKLWNHLLDYCKEANIHSFEIVTSPQAEAFYHKMGAKTVGTVESLLRKGRIIPKLVYNFQ